MSHIKIETIFDLLKNKDTYGFELLYENYFRMMYGIAFSITKNEEQSKDVIQNAIVKLWSLPEEKYPNTYELTWLYKVIKNEALMLIRKEKPSATIELKGEIPQINCRIEEFIDREYFNGLIGGLNTEQQTIVTLKVLGGMKHREIADVLGKPIGTIQWMYNRSIKKLRVTLSMLTSISIFTIYGIFIRILMLVSNKFNDTNGIGELNYGTSYEFYILNDPIFIILFIISVVSIILGIIFFVNSDKFPTK